MVLAPFDHLQPGRTLNHYYSIFDVNGLKPIGQPIIAQSEVGDAFYGASAQSADSQRIVSNNVNEIIILDTSTGKRILTIPKPKLNSGLGGGNASLSADGARIAMGFQVSDNPLPRFVASIWDVKDGKEVANIPVLQDQACYVLLSPDGQTLITCGSNRNLDYPAKPDFPGNWSQIWDVATKKELVRAPWSHLWERRFSPDSKTVAVRNNSDGILMLANPRTGDVLHKFEIPREIYGVTAFTSDSKTVALVSTKDTIRWDVKSGRLLGTTPRPVDIPSDVFATQAVFDGPDRLVAMGTKHFSVFLWDALGQKLLTPKNPDGHMTRVDTVAFSPDGQEIISADKDGVVMRWDATTGSKIGESLVIEGNGETTLTQNGKCAFRGNKLLAMSTGKQIADVSEHVKPGYLGNIFPTQDGSFLAGIMRPSPLCIVYDVSAKKEVFAVTLLSTSSAVAISPNFKMLFTAVTADKNYFKGWDVATGNKLGELELPADRIQCLVAIDDDRAVAGTSSGRVIVFDGVKGSGVREIPDTDRIDCSAMTTSRDRKLLAVTQWNRRANNTFYSAIKIYDVASGAILHTIVIDGLRVLDDYIHLANNTMPPEVMAFSPDGSRLAVPCMTSVLVFDLAKFSPDGKVK